MERYLRVNVWGPGTRLMKTYRAAVSQRLRNTYVYCIIISEPEQIPTLYRSPEITFIFLYFYTIFIDSKPIFVQETHFSVWPNIMCMGTKWDILAGGLWRSVSSWNETGWWIHTNVSEDNAVSIFKTKSSKYQEPAPIWNVTFKLLMCYWLTLKIGLTGCPETSVEKPPTYAALICQNSVRTTAVDAWNFTWYISIRPRAVTSQNSSLQGAFWFIHMTTGVGHIILSQNYRLLFQVGFFFRIKADSHIACRAHAVPMPSR